VLAPFNLVPVAVLLVLLPLVFSRLTPARVTAAPPPPEVPVEAPSDGVAGWLEQLPSTGALGLLGALALAWRASQGKLAPDLNTVIFAFLSLGMLLQPRPKPYLRAWNDAARSVGPLLLQYPLYGGILGLLSGSALVERLAALTFALSSRHTFALGVFLSSNAISLFVPSGGGHWAVQGPIVLPAALQLGVSPAVAAMAVAMGEQTANMIQPFWALPLLAIAGLGVRDIMGYCVLTFLISLAVFGGALVLLG
jgi:short-chain fatty acids transporter